MSSLGCFGRKAAHGGNHSVCPNALVGASAPLAFNSQHKDRSGNCFPGTVVETGICHPMEWDFYLMSHGGLQVRRVSMCGTLDGRVGGPGLAWLVIPVPLLMDW